MSPLVELGAIVAVALVYALDRFGYLPKRRTTEEAAAELKIKDQTIVRLRRERNEARDEKAVLVNVRFVEPVLAQMQDNAKLQAEVLDRLIHHNGSFKHMEESLGHIEEGLKMLTGFIAEVAGAAPPAATPRKRKAKL